MNWIIPMAGRGTRTSSLGDFKPFINVAGRRVVEQTLREKLPDDFQTAEYLLKHGFVDKIVPRTQLKDTVAQLIRLHKLPTKSPSLNQVSLERAANGQPVQIKPVI